MPIGRGVLVGTPRHASGQRYTRVVLQQKTASVGATGFPVDTWRTLATVWMNRLDLRADEQFRAQQDSAFTENQWHMEYRADMDPELVDVPATRRIVYEGRVFDIRAASVIARRQGIELITLAGGLAS